VAAIDVGAAATDRAGAISLGNTQVNKENAANDTGAITSVEIWLNLPYGDGANVEVATFSASGNDLTTRDSETLGTVTAGSKQTFSGLDMDVETGDYLGTHGTSGYMETDSSGGSDIWVKWGDYIPCTSETFFLQSDDTISLYGTGETPPSGWTGKISGVTDPAKIMGVDVTNIAEVKGVE